MGQLLRAPLLPHRSTLLPLDRAIAAPRPMAIRRWARPARDRFERRIYVQPRATGPGGVRLGKLDHWHRDAVLRRLPSLLPLRPGQMAGDRAGAGSVDWLGGDPRPVALLSYGSAHTRVVSAMELSSSPA